MCICSPFWVYNFSSSQFRPLGSHLLTPDSTSTLYWGTVCYTVITNWASETKKSRTVCSQRLRTRIERPFETSLKRWKQVTLARHAKVESFSVFSLDDHDSWHQAVIEETSRKIIVTTVRLEFRVNFCTNRIWIRFNIWRHYKWRHRNTLNRYSVFCFFSRKCWFQILIWIELLRKCFFVKIMCKIVTKLCELFWCYNCMWDRGSGFWKKANRGAATEQIEYIQSRQLFDQWVLLIGRVMIK